MKENTTVENRVLKILREFPTTRNNDMLLIMQYYYQFGHMPVDEMSFPDVIYTYKIYGMPCFETIERARRRVQSLFPEVSRNSMTKETGVETANNESVIMVLEFA